VVSVVIPVWDDYVKWLPSAIISAQQNLVTQIIVVDNASARPVSIDGADIIRLSKRVSVGEARNIGLDHVNNPYVYFLDADDQILDGAIDFLYQKLKDDPTALAASGRFRAYSKDQPPQDEWDFFPPKRAELLSRRSKLFAIANLFQMMWPSAGAALIKTAAIKQAGGFPAALGNYGEDWAPAAILASQGKIIVSSKPVRLYQVHPNSLLAQRENNQARIDMRKKTRQLLRRNPATKTKARLLAPLIWAWHRYYTYKTRRHQHNPDLLN
jgi:glycosyltransferase involved in cell wall biosynthesis